jgi:hypothetical protein
LDDVQRGAEQRVAAEGEDRRRGMDRAQTPEGRVLQAEVERRVGELEGDEGAHGERDHAPEQGRDREQADHILVVFDPDPPRRHALRYRNHRAPLPLGAPPLEQAARTVRSHQ